MGSLLINYIMYIVYIPLVVLIHEFGHAAFVKLFRREVKEISLGVGHELVRINKFVLKKTSWWTGFCAWDEIDSLATYQRIVILLGGILFNVASATILWIIGDPTYADWYRSFIVASYFVAAINLLPFQFSDTKLSDGLQIVRLLTADKK